jgi:valyl-tRNA synthetase
MLQPYPKKDKTHMNPSAVTEVNWLMCFILGVRRIRGEMNIAPAKPLPILIENGSVNDRNFLAHNTHYLKKLGRLDSIVALVANDEPPESAIALVGEMKILIPLAGLIDKAAEISRLDKEIQKIHKDLPRVRGKLNNTNFIDKAPPAVIEKEKAKLVRFEKSLKNLEQQREKIKQL